MANRRPSITRASKKQKPAARKPRGVTVIPDAFMRRVDNLEAKFQNEVNAATSFDKALLGRVQHLEEERIPAIEVLAKANAHDLEQKASPPALVLDALAAKMLQELIGSLRGIEKAHVRIAERLAELVAVKTAPLPPEGGRKRKLSPAPEAAPNPVAPAKEGVAIKTGTADMGTPVAEDPPAKKPVETFARGFEAYLMNLDNPAAKHSEACSEVKPTDPPPTFEEFREQAVRYAQKHGKAAMLKVVAPFAGKTPEEFETVKLSAVPDEKRAAALAAVKV